MRLDWPAQFDANEWFLLLSLLTVGGCSLWLPRRFPSIITALLYAMGPIMAMNADFLLGVPPIDVYNINDSGRYEVFDLLFYIVYAPFSYLFIYAFDRWRVRGLAVSLYMLAFSALGVGYEQIANWCHVFRYKNWNLGYSFAIYVFVQTLYLALAWGIRQIYEHTKREDAPEWP
ncbi:hypothetical protein [Paenibacillus xanthanilyticus]|uniref:Uncharacterized protein n=1 Tax=Paenibacillus xanthanilyticus TaxID=1783531 RepID=A0ABV8K359_9BACL